MLIDSIKLKLWNLFLGGWTMEQVEKQVSQHTEKLREILHCETVRKRFWVNLFGCKGILMWIGLSILSLLALPCFISYPGLLFASWISWLRSACVETQCLYGNLGNSPLFTPDFSKCCVCWALLFPQGVFTVHERYSFLPFWPSLFADVSLPGSALETCLPASTLHLIKLGWWRVSSKQCFSFSEYRQPLEMIDAFFLKLLPLCICDCASEFTL